MGDLDDKELLGRFRLTAEGECNAMRSSHRLSPFVFDDSKHSPVIILAGREGRYVEALGSRALPQVGGKKIYMF